MAKSVFTSNYKRLRDSLVHARKTSGLTQLDLAKKLSRPQSFVSKYERGERRLDIIEFIEIAQAVGMDAVNFVRTLQTALNVKKSSRIREDSSH